MRPGTRLRDRRDFVRDRLDAPEREDDFLEVGFLDFHGFDAEIFHPGFVEHDGVGRAFVVGLFLLGKTEAGGGAEGQNGKDAFHYL